MACFTITSATIRESTAFKTKLVSTTVMSRIATRAMAIIGRLEMMLQINLHLVMPKVSYWKWVVTAIITTIIRLATKYEYYCYYHQSLRNLQLIIIIIIMVSTAITVI